MPLLLLNVYLNVEMAKKQVMKNAMMVTQTMAMAANLIAQVSRLAGCAVVDQPLPGIPVLGVLQDCTRMMQQTLPHEFLNVVMVKKQAVRSEMMAILLLEMDVLQIAQLLKQDGYAVEDQLPQQIPAPSAQMGIIRIVLPTLPYVLHNVVMD